MRRGSWRDRPIAARGAQSLALRGAEIAAQALLILVTARFLGPEGRGLYALASLAATLCIVPLGSVWSSLAVDVAKRTRPVNALVTDAVVVAGVGGAIVGSLGIAASQAFGDLWWVVALPAAITPVLLWLTYVQGLYQALGHVLAFHAVIVGRVVAPLAFLSAAIALGAGVEAALVAWAASFVALVPLVGWHLLALSGRPARAVRGVRHYVRRVGLGVRFVPTNTVLLLNTQVALLFLAGLATTATVGVYSVAVAGAELLKVGARAVYSSVLPGVGRRHHEASADLTAKAARHSILLGAVGSAVVVPASVLLLPLLIGPGYGDVPLLLGLLVPSVVAYGAFLALTAFFTVQVVKPELMTVASAVMLGTTLACAAVLVPALGAAGAAVATSIGSGVGAAHLVRSFARLGSRAPATLVPGRTELRDYVALARMLAARIGRRRTAPAAEGV
jgi:O-antigen/teichoic acid export membrane protein